MNLKDKKPMLSITEQIAHLKSKGIKFEICDEERAIEYLQKNNYYFKLTSYRKNYDKYSDGLNKGKYINLDFEYLIDLSVIDKELRYLLVQLTFDIEHYLKIHIQRLVQENQEDGYKICKDFIELLGKNNQKGILLNEIDRNSSSIYCGDLVRKYGEEMPIWVFLEIISFGQLVSFYDFCSKRYNNKTMKDMHYMLKKCKRR